MAESVLCARYCAKRFTISFSLKLLMFKSPLIDVDTEVREVKKLV